jgi:hypothetical protein
MPIDIPPEAKDAAPGIIGALVAIPFTSGPLLMRVSMFVGGSSLSLYGSAPLADALGMRSSIGLAGFVVGLFGMSIAAKVYEGIATFAAGDIGAAVTAWFRKMLGV